MNKLLRARGETSGSGHNDVTKPQHGTANARQHSGYSNSSIHTLYTAEILQLQWLPQGGGKGNNFMHGIARPAGDLKLRHHSH